jgi:hypothetical protein
VAHHQGPALVQQLHAQARLKRVNAIAQHPLEHAEAGQLNGDVHLRKNAPETNEIQRVSATQADQGYISHGD